MISRLWMSYRLPLPKVVNMVIFMDRNLFATMGRSVVEDGLPLITTDKELIGNQNPIGC